MEYINTFIYDQVWYWKSRLPERNGKPCRILARGKKNSILVEFEDGFKTITSRYAVRGRNEVLKAIFKKVHYIIEVPGGNLALKIDEINPRFDNFLKENSYTTWTFITPQNPHAQKTGVEENLRFLKEFFKEIEGRQFLKAHTETPGALWPEEQGACIFAVSLEEALKIARKFCQKAIVYGEIYHAPQLFFC